MTHKILVRLSAAAAVLALSGCSQDTDVAKREAVRKGDEFVQQQKLNEAVIEYRNAIQQDSLYGEARLKLADAYSSLGDAQNAVREYIRAADLLPDRADVQLKAATVLL